MNQLTRQLFFAWVKIRNSKLVRGYYSWDAERFRSNQAANGNRFERWTYRLVHGRHPNFANPTSFTEKMVCKKLFDRNPMLPVFADKDLMRGYVREKLGDEADDILIEQLFSSANADDIPFDELTGSYVIKANHGCRMNILVREGDDIDRDLIRAKVRLWLGREFGLRRNEWCYSQIPPRVVIERMLLDDDGVVPKEVKIHCFGGVFKTATLISDRYSDLNIVLVDRNFERVDYQQGRMKESAQVSVPSAMDRLIKYAETLAEGTDYLRVDFYVDGDNVHIGELTNYHAGGRSKINPTEKDIEMGALWEGTQPYLPE